MQQVGSRQYDDVLLYSFFVGNPSAQNLGLGPGTDLEDAKRRMQPQTGNQTLTMCPQMPLVPQVAQAVAQMRQAEAMRAKAQAAAQPEPKGPSFTPREFGSMGGKV